MNTLKPYEFIIAIAQNRSISLAADKLHIQQPTLSRYLHTIEESLGAELFDRSTTPLSLTPEGICYIEAAKQIIDTENQLKKKIANIQRSSSNIKIGISPSRAPYYLPTVIKKFRSYKNQTQISILEMNIDNIISSLKEGKIDLAISLKTENMREFEELFLFQESLFLAVPYSSTINNFDDVLQAKSLIVPSLGQDISEIYNPLTSTEKIYCNNITTAVSMVKNNCGVSILPSYIKEFGNNESDIRFIDLPNELSLQYKRDICLFYRKQHFLGNAEHELIKTILTLVKPE